VIEIRRIAAPGFDQMAARTPGQEFHSSVVEFLALWPRLAMRVQTSVEQEISLMIGGQVDDRRMRDGQRVAAAEIDDNALALLRHAQVTELINRGHTGQINGVRPGRVVRDQIGAAPLAVASLVADRIDERVGAATTGKHVVAEPAVENVGVAVAGDDVLDSEPRTALTVPKVIVSCPVSMPSAVPALRSTVTPASA
jgi:hypothetical protein